MPQQIKILIVIFTLMIGGLIAARHVMVPETFGDLGHYRAASVDSIAALPIRYAGERACIECHDDIGEVKTVSHHKGVSCEVCHGAAAIHADDPDELPEVKKQRTLCSICHNYNPSRPTGFPQIDPAIHYPIKACITCHNPHEPEPEPSENSVECSACHGEIARTKLVSHHAQIECTRCHETSEEHKIRPRSVRPGKPETRQVCGACHSKLSSELQEITHIDMDTHEPQYVCWQCHYPHFPETK